MSGHILFSSLMYQLVIYIYLQNYMSFGCSIKWFCGGYSSSESLQLFSFVKAGNTFFLSVEITLRVLQVATIAWFEADSVCGSHSVAIPLVLVLPYLFRLFQCLRQYKDTGEKTTLLNGMLAWSFFFLMFHVPTRVSL